MKLRTPCFTVAATLLFVVGSASAQEATPAQDGTAGAATPSGQAPSENGRTSETRATSENGRTSETRATSETDARSESSAPPPASDGYTLRPSAMMGLTQWTLFGGGNVAAQLKVGRVAFEYSHGQALDFSRLGGLTQTAAENDAGVSVRMPWTTGGGVGFQITPRLHVLVEVKAHRYEVTGANANEVVSYTSFTVGPGVFYDLYLYRGLFLQPSVRWWPTFASTYDEKKAALTRTDGTRYQHERHDLVPFVNVSLGYTFAGL